MNHQKHHFVGIQVVTPNVWWIFKNLIYLAILIYWQSLCTCIYKYKRYTKLIF